MQTDVDVDVTRWSGDGAFTRQVLTHLQRAPLVARVRVEDAPASREETGYLFISTELFVGLRSAAGRRPWWRVFARAVEDRRLEGIDALRDWLETDTAIGPPDFADAGMLQYLRTERIIPPYQSRGYKLIEMVRIYLADGAAAR